MRTKLPDVVGGVLLSVSALLLGCGASESSEDVDRATAPPPHDASSSMPEGAGGLLDGGLRLGAPLDSGITTDSGEAAVDGAVPADTCDVQAPTECPTPAPTYATVAPIFAERCVTCHAGNWNGPWPLNAYRHVADWKDDIRTQLLACTMPPIEARVPMTRAERLTILTWIRCGIPM